MSNNTVNIRGYLCISKAHPYIGRNGSAADIEGWIYTDSAMLGGRHPFIAAGKPAEIILAHVREHALHSVVEPPNFPAQATGVVVRGKLVSFRQASYLDVRSVHFFQATLSMDRFALNDLTLGGQLMVKAREVGKQQVGSVEVPALDVVLATDAPYNGGHHPILFLNKQAEQVMARFQQNRFQPFGATVGGRLVTMQNGSLVQASFVCLEVEERCIR